MFSNPVSPSQRRAFSRSASSTSSPHAFYSAKHRRYLRFSIPILNVKVKYWDMDCIWRGYQIVSLLSEKYTLVFGMPNDLRRLTRCYRCIYFGYENSNEFQGRQRRA